MKKAINEYKISAYDQRSNMIPMVNRNGRLNILNRNEIRNVYQNILIHRLKLNNILKYGSDAK